MTHSKIAARPKIAALLEIAARGAIACALVAGFAASARGDASPSGDAALVSAVRAAAAARLSPEKAEAQVGRPAAVDTRRKDHWAILRHANIYPDDAAQTHPVDFSAARQVMYWARSIPARNAPIVGLIWRQGGAVEAFTAFVLPP